jgi:hypothetical protein
MMATTGAGQIHPDAPHHVPFFITAPGITDGLMVATGAFLLAAVVGIGVLYFKLHALPEQMAHRGQKVQFELVAVLALLALFTHNHAFWVAGLLIALLPLPDITTPLSTIAASLEKIAQARVPSVPEPPLAESPGAVAAAPDTSIAARGEQPAAMSTESAESAESDARG